MRRSLASAAVLGCALAVAQVESADTAVVPFRITVPDAVLQDLDRRLAATRFPDELPGTAWDY